MKKLAIISAASALLLTACSSEPIKYSALSEQSIDGIKHICLKEGEVPKLAEYNPTVVQYLKNRGISSEIMLNIKPGCEYAVSYALNEKNGAIVNGKFRLVSINPETGDIKTRLREVSYWQKSSEEEQVAKTGLKGQVEKIFGELLK